MGTGFEVLLRGDDAQHLEAVAVAICDEIGRLDALLSRFNPSGEVARINREAGPKPVRVDREIFALFERCLKARELTGGWFDVTAASGGNGLMLDAECHTVRLIGPEAAIDLGAIGKGYALDQAAGILKRYGVTSGLMHGGTSSVLAIGEEGWTVDIRHPLFDGAGPAARLDLTNRAISCSAVRHPGQPDSDLVDPHTGSALTGNAACVVIAPQAVEAEILSTALLAMGRKAAVKFLRNNFISEDLRVGWIETGNDMTWLTDNDLQ